MVLGRGVSEGGGMSVSQRMNPSWDQAEKPKEAIPRLRFKEYGKEPKTRVQQRKVRMDMSLVKMKGSVVQNGECWGVWTVFFLSPPVLSSSLSPSFLLGFSLFLEY
jgi:hypothetical protein